MQRPGYWSGGLFWPEDEISDDEFSVSWRPGPRSFGLTMSNEDVAFDVQPREVIDLTEEPGTPVRMPLPPHINLVSPPREVIEIPASYRSPVPAVRRRSAFEAGFVQPRRASPAVRPPVPFQVWKDGIVARMIEKHRVYRRRVNNGERIYSGLHGDYLLNPDGSKVYKPSWEWEDHIEESDHNVRVSDYFRFMNQ